MWGSAVGTGGGPDGTVADDVGAVAGEPRRDDAGAGADGLVGGCELAATAEDEATGALGSELAAAVGRARCDDEDVHALRHSTATTTSAATQRLGGITKAKWWGRRRTQRRTRSAIRRRWPSGMRSACPFRRPSR